MSLLNSILKVFVGDKVKKDLKTIQPIVNKIKTYQKALSKLSINELRAKTTEFKAKIKFINHSIYCSSFCCVP